MLHFLNPDGAPKPFSRYSQAVAAPGDYRWLHISGQVGATIENKILEGFEAQARQCWKNLIAIAAAAGYGLDDIVKVNVFLTRAGDVGASRAIRDEMLQGRAPASTLLVISALAHPDLLVEIEMICAKPSPARAAAKKKAKAVTKRKAARKAPKARSKTKGRR